MTTAELRKKYLDFFKQKGHAIIPSASLLPENDPTTLFTGSGMQPMIPYLLGEKHPQGALLADSQKCFRSQDIDEVGDNHHTTFFEMLGNWSLGDYFKEEQIPWLFEFLTDVVGLDPARIYVSVFKGKNEIDIPRDEDSAQLWQDVFAGAGIEAKIVDGAEKKGMQKGRIFYYDETENWWSRSGVTSNMPAGEPGGPDSEIFWDFGEQLGIHEKSEYKDQPCHVNCNCGRFNEIGNSVFMQYRKTDSGFESLPHPNIDFGGGLERMVMASIDTPDVFKIDTFVPVITKIEEISGQSYDAGDESVMKAMRIIADHIRAATMIMADVNGVEPSKADQGYMVRRLIRRAVRYGKQIGIEEESWTKGIAEIIIDDYKAVYPEVEKKKEFVVSSLEEEEKKFSKTLAKGLKEFKKWHSDPVVYWENESAGKVSEKVANADKIVPGFVAFRLFTTYGFPFELIKEIANEKNLKVDETGFQQEMKKHQALSRSASAGKFKGGLADADEQTTKLHTATHLLQAALRQVLGDHVQQKGSNITAERLRFDFSHGEKMTPEQLTATEKLVNEWIVAELEIKCEELPYDEAKKRDVIGLFEDKYGDKVKVYGVGDVSGELCGGPHVKNTKELGKFRIKKEQSSGAGVRRIKAVLG
ncbi:MAG: alanine--tRNA ligase [Parcubacteria group bacterium]|nr:alanine--tRNA ligase [Parcubacteria group bacterium]